MKELGRVIKIKGDEITVHIIRDSDAKSCDGNCASCKGQGPKGEMKVLNSRKLGVEEGDIVEIYYPPSKTIAAAFMILILPLIFFILFYYGANILFPGIEEVGSFLAGTGGIAAGFLLNLIFSKIRKNRELPYITKIKNS